MTDHSVVVNPPSPPKRKRPDDIGNANNANDSPDGSPPIQTSPAFHAPGVADGDPRDGSASPRSKMATRFHGLGLENGGPAHSQSPSKTRFAVANGEDEEEDIVLENEDDGDTIMRKRQRLPEADGQPVTETPDPNLVVVTTADSNHGVPRPMTDPIPLARPGFHRPSLQRSLPSINRTADMAKPQHKKYPQSGLRDQTSLSAYDPRTSASSIGSVDDDDVDDDLAAGAIRIIDPLRAALTWHDDEITVYDPDDEDDDGIGINGVGFMPTPALAKIRNDRRRQQLLAYRQREKSEAQSEARLRRGERRDRRALNGLARVASGGSSASSAALATVSEVERARRVRFTEEAASQGMVLSG